MDKENRTHKRINKTTAVQIDDSYAMLVDLSRTGMRLIPDSLPKKIEKIRISFITENGELIDLQASIVRIVDRTGKDGKYELGLSLLNAPENYYRYIEALEKGESPRGLSPQNLRQDLVKAVLESKPDGLALPQTPAAATTMLEPEEALSAETVEMSIDSLFQEAGEKPSFAGPEAEIDETIEMSLDGALKEPGRTPTPADLHPPLDEEEAAGEEAEDELNIPLEEMLQEEEVEFEPQTPAEHAVSIPLEEMLQEEKADSFEPLEPPPPLPTPAENQLSIPLEEILQEEESMFEPEEPPASPGEIGGETVEMPFLQESQQPPSAPATA
ncbi:MAG: PilZ domain-containing protein, partial [Candidatus Aminicenantes bacterium]|nr:PilZ domain-containing protein [Candidatus Aminicenantes bacterium]